MISLPRRKPDELATMRRAGRVVAEMHERIRGALAPGVTTAQLDQIGRDVLVSRGATSNFLGYHGYPAVICASINNMIIHGIPGTTPADTLAEGDIVSIDCGAIIDGWHADAAFTAAVGTPSGPAARLMEVTDEALAAGMAAMVPGGRVGDIGAAVEKVVVSSGFAVVREYCGHGIGRAMHERPDVPNYGPAGRGAKLTPGVTLAVEPMVVAGSPEVFVADDGWSVLTCDDAWSAHAEHTILVTDDGPEVLTRP